jgi:hypothetical protein
MLEGEAIDLAETEVTTNAPSGIRHAELPGFLAEAGARGIEKALRDRLADKLAVTLLVDPVTRQQSSPGEDRAAFAARLGAEGGGAAVQKLQAQLEKKQVALATREQDLSGRKSEKWMAIGSAVLSNIGLFTGRKRTVTGASSVLSKNRLENNAEAQVEALRAEVADLTRQVAAASAIDPARFQEESLVPARTAVKVLRYDLLWVS